MDEGKRWNIVLSLGKQQPHAARLKKTLCLTLS